VSVTLPGQIAAPTKPVVQVLDVGPTHASLSWSSTDDGTLIWYTIFVDGQAVRSLNSRSFTFTCASVAEPTYCVPFDRETTYVFTVHARDVDGNRSPTSDPVSVTTAPAPDDHTPPTSPTNIVVDDIGGFSMVSWDASTDDIADQRFIRCDIYVDGELRTVVVGATTAEVETDLGATRSSRSLRAIPRTTSRHPHGSCWAAEPPVGDRSSRASTAWARFSRPESTDELVAPTRAPQARGLVGRPFGCRRGPFRQTQPRDDQAIASSPVVLAATVHCGRNLRYYRSPL
jgi:hypothetical protein